MRPGFVCIAGIDPATKAHIRPIVPSANLRRTDINVGGRELTIGTEIDIGRTTPAPNPPDVEDHEFKPASMRRVRDLTPTEFFILLMSAAQPSLASIFGASLEPDGRTASVAPGSGTVSLGCLKPAQKSRITVMFDKVKLRLEDGGRDMLVAVTDLRLYELDQQTPDRRAIAAMNAAMASGAALLSVGLSRAHSRPGEDRPRHWLQINNVHVRSEGS